MVAVSTTLLSLGFYELVRRLWISEMPGIRIISIAPWAALFVIWLISANWFSRLIWAVCCKMNKSLFPDLNGSWEGEITTENGILIPARALVVQNLFKTRIDIHTATSRSATLETTPSMELGQAKIYYMYRAFPKSPGWSPYTGATIFDVRCLNENKSQVLELSGLYFTDRKSIGRVRLRRVNADNTKDVSYY